jgi:hypothetical protein
MATPRRFTSVASSPPAAAGLGCNLPHPHGRNPHAFSIHLEHLPTNRRRTLLGVCGYTECLRDARSTELAHQGRRRSKDESMNGDNPLWYDCDEEAPQRRTSFRITRVAAILALLAAAYLVYRVLF